MLEATRHDVAPTTSATRGLLSELIVPTRGAPIGVDPRNPIENSASTLPRISSREASCKVAFAVDMNASEHAPIKIAAS